MKLGFIILAHNEPDAVRRLACLLAGGGHTVVIHFDKKAPAAQQHSVRALEKEYPGLVHVVSKVHCVWGDWSLVEAVLVALREFEGIPEKPDYVHLMSGADFPIRPLTDLQEFLRRNSGKDFIECCDITQRRWVKGGLSMERFRFFFPVSFRTSRTTFDRLVRWHRKLKIRRKIPLGMTPHMGSQWWTLRWSTCTAILDFLRENPRVIRYFRSTWIPDEAFFQTVVAHLIPRREIADLQFILHHLTPTGRPYVIHPDHLPQVRKLPHFFVRKVSPAALDGIEALARSRRSLIPKPSQLARVRDLVRGAIDRNYQLSTIVPGHPYGPAIAHKSKSVLVFLTDNAAQTALVRANALAHPNIVWGGFPFAPDAIDLSDFMLAATGLTRGMTDIRSQFLEQFADTLASGLCDDKATVFVVPMADVGNAWVLLARIPDIRFASFRSHPSVTSLPIHLIRHVPERKIRRSLDESAPEDPATNSLPDTPWIVAHHFGRIGNYFHLDATIHHSEATASLDLSFILPGAEFPVQPESVFTRRDSSGGIRSLSFFLVDDGAYLNINLPSPAHVLLDLDVSLVPPYALPTLRESTVDDLILMLDSYCDPAPWADRVVLATVASAPIAQRFDFLLRAKPHWSDGSAESHMATLLPEEAPHYPSLEDNHSNLDYNESSPEPWEISINEIQQMAVQDITAACAIALPAIQAGELPRQVILRAVHPCLPRNSKWWLLALDGFPGLGDEQVADALNSIGSSASHQGQPVLAELCFTAALVIHPSAQSISWNLGLLLASQGRKTEATTRFHAIGRHYANESISTSWPARDHVEWPACPWPTDGFTLPKGVTSWPRISVVTPSYNQAAYIEETIHSVIHQNYPNLQYIVVDGNSTDGTRGILERYQDRIDHLIIEPDDGQTQAINKGFKLADGELVAWLNSDDMYAPGTFHQVALTWLEKRADVVAGICLEHIDRRIMTVNKPSARNSDFNTPQLAQIFKYWLKGYYFYQPEVFFSRRMLNEVGLLDESLYYSMDYELWMRFAKAGALLEVVDWPFAFFRKHDAQKTSNLVGCINEQARVRNRHHPLMPNEERDHQIRRKIELLKRRTNLVIGILAKGQNWIYSKGIQEELDQFCNDGTTCYLTDDELDPRIVEADPIILLTGAVDCANVIGRLRASNPDQLIAGWLWENDQKVFENHSTAEALDIVLFGHASYGEYLQTDQSICKGSVPPCVIRWARQDAAAWFSEGGWGSRGKELYGNFVGSTFEPARIEFLNRVIEMLPKHAISIQPQKGAAAFPRKSEQEEFADECGHAVCVILSQRSELPSRIFDALLAGQIPLVANDVEDLDAIVSPGLRESLPVLTYDLREPASLIEAGRSAVRQFEQQGPEGASRRHLYALKHHTFSTRVNSILEILELRSHSVARLILSGK